MADTAVVADTVEAEVLVGGKPLPPPADCPHGTLTLQPLVGVVKDDAGTATGWQLRVRARCAMCGVPFGVDLDSARAPRDHWLGVVLDLYPLDEEPADLPVDLTD